MPKLYFPVKPFLVNQSFGANKDYYMAQFGTNGHMGIDVFRGHGMPVYAAHDGNAFFVRDSHGGEGIYISTEGFQTIYWHLCGDTDPAFPSPIPTDGKSYPVKAGDIIGHADNTGAPYESSGDHLHMGLRLLNADGSVMNPDNGFGGCIDPAPYFNGFYAEDSLLLLGYYGSLITLLKAMVATLLNKKT